MDTEYLLLVNTARRVRTLARVIMMTAILQAVIIVYTQHLLKRSVVVQCDENSHEHREQDENLNIDDGEYQL